MRELLNPRDHVQAYWYRSVPVHNSLNCASLAGRVMTALPASFMYGPVSRLLRAWMQESSNISGNPGLGVLIYELPDTRKK